MIILKKKENCGGGNDREDGLRKTETENNRQSERSLTYDYTAEAGYGQKSHDEA